ncbi:MAG: hypothetical protein PHW27_04800 [Melioribacteraceae bacterium]|nr:hypothetical protein [Melioribacteraceae bacterium]MDD3557871.1 hypothetical protein [Melioribacteraceae bacterium]
MTHEDLNTNKSRVIFFSRLISVLIFIYILLFEFILLPNQFLPKPTILIESFLSLFSDYNFRYALLHTTSIIYAVIFLLYWMYRFLNSVTIKFSSLIPFKLNYTSYAVIFAPLFFSFWLDIPLWGEVLYVFIVVDFQFFKTIHNSLRDIKPEYIIASKSLEISQKDAETTIIWNLLKPEIFKSYKQINITTWMSVILFEYFTALDGTGSVLTSLVLYHDFSGIIAFMIVITLLIFVANLVIGYLHKKFADWEQ